MAIAVRPLLRAGLLVIALVDVPVAASTRLMQGVIKEIKADGTVVALAYDFYNAGSHGEKAAEMLVPFSADVIFVLDDLIVPRDLALAPGRRFFGFGSGGGGVKLMVVLSEPAEQVDAVVKQVAKTGGSCVLRQILAKDGIDIPVTLDDRTLFQEAGQAMTRAEVLGLGNTVRFMPGRKQVVLAFSPATLAKPRFVLEGDTAVAGVVTAVKADGAVLAVLTDQVLAEQSLSTRIGVIGHAVYHAPWADNVCIGRRVALFNVQKRRGKFDEFVVAIAGEPGRLFGTVKEATQGTVRLAVQQGAALKEQEVEILAGAEFRLDGQLSTAAEALKPGHVASVFAPRPLTIQLLKRPEKDAVLESPEPDVE